ncbi:hypothetical protein AHAS_Ahas15G0173400 [Arachis hypogaea]
MLLAPPQPPRIEGPSRSCGICACNGHYTDECPQIQEDNTLVVANSHLQRSNFNQGNQGSYHYGGNQGQGSINAITLRSGTKLDEVDLKPTSVSKETHDEEIEEDVEVEGGEKEDVVRKEEDVLKVKEPKRKNPLEEPI